MQPFCPVILAGGGGNRFWPLSRRERPKPFLAPVDGPPLLERAWQRALSLAPAEDVFVATEATLAGRVRQALPGLAGDRLIVEPWRRNTGPAAVHAAWYVEKRRPGAILAMLPADHVVERPEALTLALRRAHSAVTSEGGLVCLGVPPTRPSSAYGYIETPAALPRSGEVGAIQRFVEKPSAEEVSRLLADGRSLWNTGIFVWGAAEFLAEVGRLAGKLAECLQYLQNGDPQGFFACAPDISVDRAVLERTERARVVAADPGWDDLGSWDALRRHVVLDGDGNGGRGLELAVRARGCLVDAGKPVVLVGVEDLVVVDCDDVLLVTRHDEAQSLREIPGRLEAKGKSELT